MNKEFIPYEQALALKELGFDEPCFGYYMADKNIDTFLVIEKCKNVSWLILAPLYQQAFRWFREKYNWHVDIKIDDKSCYFYDCISNKIGKHDRVIQREHSKTYEEAELACLIKLIEIVKNK
jgi:hypothetical protein